MRRKKNWLLSGVILLASLNTFAATNGDLRSWNVLFLKKDLNERWRFVLENQLRVKDNISRIQQYLFRPVISYRLSPETWIGLGYVWEPNFNPYQNQNVIFPQLDWQPSGNIFSFRTRLEQRFIQDRDMVIERFRQRILARLPLRTEVPTAFIVAEEPFFYLNTVSGGPSAGFDQNRLTLAAEFTLSKSLSWEFGVLNQYAKSATGGPDTVAMVLQQALTWKL